jgi:beta-barrel assembly-enhancing protease
MRYVPSRPVTHRRECTVSLASMACALALLFSQIPSRALAQTSAAPSIRPISESLPEVSVPEADAKKLDKYNVARIGQRGIGHGFNLYSIKRERELGQNLAASLDRYSKVVNDAVINDYVNRLAQKIVGNSDADIPFTVKVIDSGDIPRAYGIPGGFLYVDTALILAADGEAELAGVIAHEIAHVAARHATRALTRKRLSNIANSLALFAGPAGIAINDVGGIAGPLSLKKFLRDSEYEADLLGIEYSYTAGYDPLALLDALEKLRAIENKRTENLAKIPGYHFVSRLPFHSKLAKSFSNYPLTEERLQRLQSEISDFLPRRNDYILDTDEFQEVKSRLLAFQAPVLRHHGVGDEDNKGPVLRRDTEFTSTPSSSPPVSPASEIANGFVVDSSPHRK